MSNTLPLTQVEVNVSRDPSRLYKLTAGWEQRKKEGPGTAGHGPSLHMPHRYATLFSHTIRPPFVRMFFSIAYHKEPGNPLNLLFCAPLLTEQLPSLQLMRGKIEASRDLVSCVSHALGRPRFLLQAIYSPYFSFALTCRCDNFGCKLDGIHKSDGWRKRKQRFV